MKHIVLLRFHKDIEIVQNRIDLLRHFNPEIKIYGAFGGTEKELLKFRAQLKGLENITLLSLDDDNVKWQFSDLAILDWYNSTGKDLNFDIVYTIEYDLVILDSLQNVYKTDSQALTLTGVIKLEDIKCGWLWVDESPLKEESEQFLQFMKDNFDINTPYGSLGPGSTMPKSFLERYSKEDIPQLAHDELRFPQLATAFGYKIIDTGFYRNWNRVNPESSKVFNCNPDEVPIDLMLSTYHNDGWKVFHPVYEIVPIEKL